MSLSPVDFSMLANNQRSDISKLTGGEYSRIQHDQIAASVEKLEEHQRNQAQQVDMTEEMHIKEEEEGTHSQKGQSHGKREKEDISKEEKNEDQSYVGCDDPDLGNILDWQG